MEELLEIIKQQASTIDNLTNELALLREQVAYLTQKLYGKSSEKSIQVNGQLSLFDEEQLPEEDDDLPRSD
ncbi:IS66 family transposase [Streptococcus thoraltensis]|uniref:IS66 family transposase n=1 Tax=Streptococcus thoraltensis TaxID=55085 RepID=UPI000362C8A1